MERTYYKQVWRQLDQEKAMVLVTGPRQAGKTTLAQQIAHDQAPSVYLNYDVPADRVRLADHPDFFEQIDREPVDRPLVILDEIHKYKDWKNYLKGLYDGYHREFRFLITGSGRLDLYQQQGDALAGRFRRFTMFPFTLGELMSVPRQSEPGPEEFTTLPAPVSTAASQTFQQLLTVSGFPEPFLRGTKTAYRRWANAYHAQIVRDDVRDAFNVRDIHTMMTLYEMLPARVGSPLSVASLSRLLKTSHKTVSSWLSVFAGLQLIFSIRPYTRRVSRSLLKEPKFYLHDIARISDPGGRFENLVALELKRAVVNWTEHGLGDYDLWYLRTKEGRETDFLITRDGNPLVIVESKTADPGPSVGLRFFQEMLNVPAVQLVAREGISRRLTDGRGPVLVVTAHRWLAQLG